MNDSDLDRMLMESEEIVPSSGFVASVMEAVQQEAAAPAPIPFPWKWAVPGFVVSVAMAMGLIVRWLHSAAPASHPVHPLATALPIKTLSSTLSQVNLPPTTVVALEWSALALLVSFATVWLSMRIAGVRE
jgi:hypothetical protein